MDAWIDFFMSNEAMRIFARASIFASFCTIWGVILWQAKEYLDRHPDNFLRKFNEGKLPLWKQWLISPFAVTLGLPFIFGGMAAVIVGALSWLVCVCLFPYVWVRVLWFWLNSSS